MYGELGTNSMVYQNQGGGLQVLPLWSASANGPFRPQWIDQLGNFQLFDWFDGDYIPMAGTTHLRGDIVPTSSGTYNLGSANYTYNSIYVNNVYTSLVETSKLTSSNSKLDNVYSQYISSSLLTASNAQLTNVYSNYISSSVITSSVINSTLYDDTAVNVGFAYFDENHQLVGGGTIHDIPGFDEHTHYITESIKVGNTPDGATDSTQMFLRGNDGIDSKPQWTYIVPSYVKSDSDLTALTGPGLLVNDYSSSYLNGRWVTTSVDLTSSRIAGVKKGENVVSFFTVNDALDDTIIDVPHGGTSWNSLTKYAVLLGDGTDPIKFASPSTAGQALISNGSTSYPSFGVVGVVGGGTGLNSISTGQIIYGGTTANTYSKLNIGTTGQVLEVSGGVPTWKSLSTLSITGCSNALLGAYNPTGSAVSINITPESICAADAYHTHSANDIVSGQLAIARIPTGTSYDTVALGNHTHANLNLTIGSTTVTYDGGYEVDFTVTTQDIQDNLGVVPVSHGGTGITSSATGVILLGTGTETMSRLEPGTNNYPLVSNGAGSNPSYRILPYQGGGTGIGSYSTGDILYYNGSSLARLAKGNQGQALVINNNLPTWSNTVISSSYAISSSYTEQADKLSTPRNFYIVGGITSNVQPFDGTDDVELNVTEIDPSYITGVIPIDKIPTGSYNTFIANTFIGDLNGTASYAEDSLSSSYTAYAQDAISASYALKATTSSYADYAKNALSSSYANNSTTSSYSLYAKDALSASYALNATTASYALEASSSFYSIYANAAERLLTPFKISIHGAATAEAQYVDGQTDVQLSVYELDANYLYGMAPIQVIPTGSTSDTVAVGNHTHSNLTHIVNTGTGSKSTIYNAGSAQTFTTNDGTFQLLTYNTSTITGTISQASNTYHNHTVFIDARSANAKDNCSVTMSMAASYLSVGDKILIKSMTNDGSGTATFKYTVYTGSYTVLNRKGMTETVLGSYGVDIELTYLGSNTWIYERKPVSFTQVG